MSAGVKWRRDEKRRAYVSDDGRSVTDEHLANLDPDAASLLRQVLNEAVSNG